MINKLFYYLAIPFFIPHFLLYIFYPSPYLKEDVNQWKNQFGLNELAQPRLFFRLIITFKEFRSVFYYRIGGIGRLLNWYSPGMLTLYIPVSKHNIGPGLIIHHGHSSRIGPRKAGKNLQVWQNVTIGKNKSGGKQPIIGNNVKIMTNSIVFGDITIGNNVVIAAGTVVFKNVPDNCVVVGNPARIVKINGEKVDIKL